MLCSADRSLRLYLVWEAACVGHASVVDGDLCRDGPAWGRPPKAAWPWIVPATDKGLLSSYSTSMRSCLVALGGGTLQAREALTSPSSWMICSSNDDNDQPSSKHCPSKEGIVEERT
jgi:hypothetical protein